MSQADINTYGLTQPRGVVGQISDLSTAIVDSFAAQVAVAFGRVVVRGTDGERQCAPANNASNSFLGVAVHTHSQRQGFNPNTQSAAGAASTDAVYAIGDTVSVLRFGRVLVEVVGAATAGADAYAIVADTADRGKFTATVGSNLGPVGRFLTTVGSGGGLVEVEITAALRGATGPQGAPGG